MKVTTRRIAFAGVLAAVYAALTILEGMLVPSLAYGTVQFRFAEALAVLCCFTPAAIPSMVVGCMAANLFSFVSAWDFVIGSLATLLAALLTWRMSQGLLRNRRWLAWLIPLPTILCNAVIVGAEIAIFFDERAFLPAWGVNAAFVGLGEAAVMYVLGLPLLYFLWNNKRVAHQLRTV